MPEMNQTAQEIVVCYRHPKTETSLRCNRCGRPICAKCAVRTPVGFRCPECVREQQNKYYTGGALDYVIAVVVALPLSLIAAAIFILFIGLFISRIVFFSWIISFFAAPAAGGIIAEAVRWAVGRRRSRYLNIIVAGCLVVGVVPFLLLELLNPGFNLLALVTPGILLFLGVGTIVARLR
jgi:hypothetical protein